MTLKRSVHKHLADLCQFHFSDGRLCRMLRWEHHPQYCLVHARQEQQLLEADRIGSELSSLSGDFKTATDINHALGRLWTAVTHNRIPPRNAAVLAYIGQLLLQTLPAVKHEINRAHNNFQAWESLLRRVFPPPQPHIPPAPRPAADSAK